MDCFVREAQAIVGGRLVIVRLGTCGIIQEGRIGMIAVSEGSLIVQRNYDYPFAGGHGGHEPAYLISRVFHPHNALTRLLVDAAKEQFGSAQTLTSVNASTDSFYASQGRSSAAFDDSNDHLVADMLARNVNSVEMESGHLLHLACCSRGSVWAGALHIVVADRINNEFLTNRARREKLDRLGGLAALNALTQLDCRQG